MTILREFRQRWIQALALEQAMAIQCASTDLRLAMLALMLRSFVMPWDAPGKKPAP